MLVQKPLRSSFLVSIVVAHHIKPLTLALQSSKCDVYKAFVDVQTCKQAIEDQSCDEVFQRCIWSKLATIAESVGVEL
jgi:hypothetical protein